MTHRLAFLFALAILTAGLTPPARLQAQPRKGGPLKPEEALAALKVADGFQVELFAAEPMLINPTTIDVDHKGRVWVAEAVNYRRKNFGRPIIRKEGDRIVVLVDAKGEGKASEAKTFYQGEEIIAPLGVCVAPYADGKGQKVFVCQSPDILVFEDKDGDLKADGPPKKFLSGFRGIDHDHGVHGINIGPDGKLYFTVGDSGVGGLQSADGKGKKWTSNDTDCQKGTVWRCDMDGNNLELIAHNFRNNYECCVDSFGEVWLSDNDDDGNQQTRICFVMPGGNYGYGPRGPGQSHWHEEQPGIVHKTLRTGFGSPTGITFYEGSLFPKKYTGALLHCDAGPREVRWFFRKPKGAGYELDKEVLLTSTDNWFRPSDVCVAPDGSIFVADWYDRGVGGHGMGDPTDGRIYRITPKGHKGYKVPEVKLETKEGVLAALGSPCQATRALALKKLLSLDVKQALTWLTNSMQDARDRRLAVLCYWHHCLIRHRSSEMLPPEAFRMWLEFIVESIRNPELDPHVVRITNASFAHDLTSLPKIPSQSQDKREQSFNLRSIAACREILLSGRIMPGEFIKPDFYALAKRYDGSDHFYLAALSIACGTDPARRDAILADFDKHFPEWNDKVADLVWELRPKSVLPRLGKLLADDKLTPAQKARIVDIIASNDDPAAGQAMLDVLKSDAAPEVKARAIESLRMFLPSKWKGLQSGKELAAVIDTLLKEPKTQATGLQLIAAAGAANHIDAIGELIGTKEIPLETRLEAVRTLGKLRHARALELLDASILFANDRVQLEAIRSVGSQITNNPKDQLSARALGMLQTLVTGKGAHENLRKTAVEALAGSRPGTAWLLDTHAKGDLPKELVAEAGRLLRNSPFQGERNRALLLFPAPGKLNPKNLPPVAELAKRAGDASRGKAVWNASFAGAAQCSKCHMVRGVGGQVGPDLSMIGKKSAREALYESILNPSKAIADQFIQHQVTTTAEVTVSGLLVGETPEAITLRDANGKDTTVPRKEIMGEVRKLKVSLMADDIVAALNEDELADLIAYLETLKTAALTPDAFQIVGPFPAKNMDDALDTEFGPEKLAFDPKLKYRAKDELIGWKTIRPDGKGYFDLAGAHGNAANNSASYMFVEIDSPADQDGEILLGVDDGSRLWVNGKDVFTSRESRAATPEQHKVKVWLRKGANTVLLKVANGNNPHGFYFALTSAEEVKVKR